VLGFLVCAVAGFRHLRRSLALTELELEVPGGLGEARDRNRLDAGAELVLVGEPQIAQFFMRFGIFLGGLLGFSKLFGEVLGPVFPVGSQLALQVGEDAGAVPFPVNLVQGSVRVLDLDRLPAGQGIDPDILQALLAEAVKRQRIVLEIAAQLLP